jgi:hypothetical protein
MVRYTIADLFRSTALVASGLVSTVLALRIRRYEGPGEFWVPAVFLALWYFGCVTVGAGVFYPFKLTTLGMRTGGFVGVMGLVVIVLGLM